MELIFKIFSFLMISFFKVLCYVTELIANLIT